MGLFNKNLWSDIGGFIKGSAGLAAGALAGNAADRLREIARRAQDDGANRVASQVADLIESNPQQASALRNAAIRQGLIPGLNPKTLITSAVIIGGVIFLWRMIAK